MAGYTVLFCVVLLRILATGDSEIGNEDVTGYGELASEQKTDFEM